MRYAHPAIVHCLQPLTFPCHIKTDIIAVQRKHYGKIYNFGYQFMVTMSTQLIGFSIGGIAKRFLVSPPSMSASMQHRFHLSLPLTLPQL